MEWTDGRDQHARVLSMVTKLRNHGAAGPALLTGAVSMPARPATPLAAVTKRMLVALGLLAVLTLIVYLGRDGYRDAAHPGQPLSVLSSVYYATVTLLTTGFGDVVPVTSTARLVNTVLITPIRVIFLIVLVGTTLEVLAERTRTGWRINRWRSRVAGQTVVIGYGTKGRSVVRTLARSGLPARSIAVVDASAEAVAEANAAGLVAAGGDGTRQSVLVIADLLDRGRGLDLVERPVAESELGTAARDAAGAVIAVVRGNDVLSPEDPRAARLAAADRLILVSSREQPANGSAG